MLIVLTFFLHEIKRITFFPDKKKTNINIFQHSAQII